MAASTRIPNVMVTTATATSDDSSKTDGSIDLPEETKIVAAAKNKSVNPRSSHGNSSFYLDTNSNEDYFSHTMGSNDPTSTASIDHDTVSPIGKYDGIISSHLNKFNNLK